MGHFVGGCSRSEGEISIDFFQKADVQDLQQTSSAIKNFLNKYKKIDILIINAGTNHFYHPDNIPFQKEINIIKTNLIGPLNILEAFTSARDKNHFSKVVLIGSVAANFGLWGNGAYSASKAGIRMLFQSYSKSYQKDNILLQIVEPGFIATNMIEHLHFPKPFQLSASEFANRLIRGIQKGNRFIYTSTPIRIFSFLLKLTPLWVLNFVQGKLDYNHFIKGPRA